MANVCFERSTGEIEARVLQLLAAHRLLSEHQLRVRAVPGGEKGEFRRVLAGLIERELVVRKVERRAFWYAGYALPSTVPDASDVALPAVFSRLLDQLVERHPEWQSW